VFYHHKTEHINTQDIWCMAAIAVVSSHEAPPHEDMADAAATVARQFHLSPMRAFVRAICDIWTLSA